jgi:hypothetical protein
MSSERRRLTTDDRFKINSDGSFEIQFSKITLTFEITQTSGAAYVSLKSPGAVILSVEGPMGPPDYLGLNTYLGEWNMRPIVPIPQRRASARKERIHLPGVVRGDVHVLLGFDGHTTQRTMEDIKKDLGDRDFNASLFWKKSLFE